MFERAQVRLGLLAAVSVCVALCPVGARGAEPIPPPHVIKPHGPPDSTAPATIDLAVDGNHSVGGGIVATFVVMARKPLESARLQIVLPDGVQQTAGDAAWQGPMAAGEVRIVELSAKLSTTGVKRFIGRVTLPGGSVLTVEKTLNSSPAPPTTPAR